MTRSHVVVKGDELECFGVVHANPATDCRDKLLRDEHKLKRCQLRVALARRTEVKRQLRSPDKRAHISWDDVQEVQGAGPAASQMCAIGHLAP